MQLAIVICKECLLLGIGNAEAAARVKADDEVRRKLKDAEVEEKKLEVCRLVPLLARAGLFEQHMCRNCAQLLLVNKTRLTNKGP